MAVAAAARHLQTGCEDRESEMQVGRELSVLHQRHSRGFATGRIALDHKFRELKLNFFLCLTNLEAEG